MRTPPPNPARGFTLVELMVTIAIAAILLSIAIPSFQATMAKSQLASHTNEFLAAMATARNEAIKNNTHGLLCASTDGASCNGTAWSNGWIVCVDTNRNGNCNAGEQVSNIRSAINGLSIQGNASVATGIRFGSDGLLFGLPGTVRVCKATTALPANENARDIVINTVGRTRVQAPNPAIATAGTCPAP